MQATDSEGIFDRPVAEKADRSVLELSERAAAW